MTSTNAQETNLAISTDLFLPSANNQLQKLGESYA